MWITGDDMRREAVDAFAARPVFSQPETLKAHRRRCAPSATPAPAAG